MCLLSSVDGHGTNWSHVWIVAVKFIWNCCVESMQQLKKEEGSGCILAHCMGLGKTLSVSIVFTIFL